VLCLAVLRLKRTAKPIDVAGTRLATSCIAINARLYILKPRRGPSFRVPRSLEPALPRTQVRAAPVPLLPPLLAGRGRRRDGREPISSGPGLSCRGERNDRHHLDRCWHDAALDDDCRRGRNDPTAGRQRGGACQLKETTRRPFHCDFSPNGGNGVRGRCRLRSRPGSRLTAPFIAQSFGGRTGK
jgi:hypothetical protein